MSASDFQVGDRVTWLYTPRGGYGYTYPVDGVVEKIGRTRVQIRVKRHNQEEALRWVSLENLRHKKQFKP